MEGTRFALSYSGRAFDTKYVDVDEYAPALISIGKVLRRAAEIEYGPDVSTTVRISAAPRHGSIIADLHLEMFVLANVLAVVQPDPRRLIELVFGDHGVLGLLRMLKGHHVERTTDAGGDSLNITVGDGGTANFNIHKNVYAMSRDPTITRGIESATRPLLADGANRMELSIDEERVGELTAVERPELDFAPTPTLVVHETERVETVTLVSPVFTHREHKWKFRQGNAEFHAGVEDEKFWEQIEAREIGCFSGDEYVVTLHTRREQSEGEPPTYSRRVLEVIERKAGPSQDVLPLVPCPDDD